MAPLLTVAILWTVAVLIGTSIYAVVRWTRSGEGQRPDLVVTILQTYLEVRRVWAVAGGVLLAIGIAMAVMALLHLR